MIKDFNSFLVAMMGAALLSGSLLQGCGFLASPAGKAVECSAATVANQLSSLCPAPITLFCTAVTQVAFEEACQAAANAGATQEQAEKAGLSAARGTAAKLEKRGVKLGEKQ